MFKKSQTSYCIAIVIVLITLIFGMSVTAAPNKSISYFFSQEHQRPDTQLCNLIDSAKSSLDIAIYSITKPNIVDSIIKAKKRGVSVRIISDKTQSGGKKQKIALDTFKVVGIPVKINTHSGLMHMKVTVIDKSIVTTGSFNYSTNAVEDNDEVFVVIKDAAIAGDFSTEFTKMWNDLVGFKSYN